MTSHPTPRRGAPAASAPWQRGHGEERIARRAVALAAAAHLALLLLPLPQAARERAPAVAPPPSHVLRSDRFKPPEPAREPLPPRRRQRVPMPVPAAAEPEPLEVTVDPPRALELPHGDLFVVVPEVPPPDPPAGPVPLRPEMEPPEKVWAPAPAYTEAARRAGVQGVAILEAVIDEEGRVTRVRVLRDLPFGLAEAAAAKVATWRYRPAMLGGRPVAVYLTVTVEFAIR